MFSFIKDKISEQLSNAQKNIASSHNSGILLKLSKPQQIMYQQIENCIQIGPQLPQQMKTHIFEYINSGQICYDSIFLQQIRQLIRDRLLDKNREKVSRSLTIIEELVANCGQVVNMTFNESKFCDALADIALYKKYVSLNYGEWDIIRKRAAGIFLFWYEKYMQDTQNVIYIDYMIKIKEGKADVPKQPFFKEVGRKNKNGQNTKQQVQNINELNPLIKGSLSMAEQAQTLLKTNPQKLNTQYIRALKQKNKILYNTAVEHSKDLDADTKTQLNAAYKRIRQVLKDIDGWNEQKNKEKAIKQEKVYLQRKMEMMGKSGAKREDNTDLLMDDNKQIQIVQPVKVSANLLDDDDPQQSPQISKQQPSLTPKKLSSPQSSSKVTPIKSQKSITNKSQEQNIIEIDIDGYSTPTKKQRLQLASHSHSNSHTHSQNSQHYDHNHDISSNQFQGSQKKIKNKVTLSAKSATQITPQQEQPTQNKSSQIQSSIASQNLIDYDDNQTPKKTLNFTQLYKQSSSPAEFHDSMKGIDFMSPSPKKEEKTPEHHKNSDKKLKDSNSGSEEQDFNDYTS